MTFDPSHPRPPGMTHLPEAAFLQVQTTFDRREDADRIGRQLVESRLAACAQVVGPIRSTYRWHDAIESADEWLCLLKTTTDRYPALESALRAAHPYDEPEVVALPIVAGSAGYLGWIDEGVEEGPDAEGAGAAPPDGG